jgi:hypothetical protein
MRNVLALLALIATAWLASPEPSCAQGSCYSTPCYAQTCSGGCRCIQPGGPGTEGFCN